MNPRYPKNPEIPPAHLSLEDSDIHEYSGALWRIHSALGSFVAPWNSLRNFGPVESCRWDPHPPPPRTHDRVGVLYTAPSIDVTFGEVFWPHRSIEITADRVLTGWMPTRPPVLLDLVASNGWALRNGASASLPFTRKDICRAWASRIHEEFSDRLDGLWVPSTVTGDPMVVLFSRAASTFPAAPNFSRSLDHPEVAGMAIRVAAEFGWSVH